MKSTSVHRHQLNTIKDRLASTHPDIENMLLDNYNVFSLEELPAKEFDEICQFIYDMHFKLNKSTKKNKE